MIKLVATGNLTVNNLNIDQIYHYRYLGHGIRSITNEFYLYYIRNIDFDKEDSEQNKRST